MWGAIIGDIVGSVYEGRGKKIKTKEFDFFKSYCRYTDDSVCTAAVAEILLDDLPAAATMQQWCRRHPRCGYGGWFERWIYDASPQPYQSFGNGAAMRVSPAAFLNRERPIEDAVRNAVSLGGDSDTLAAIAGPIAEAMHGIPEDMIETAKARHLAEAPDIVRVLERMREAPCR